MKILIMGLPGSGKTWLAEQLQVRLSCAWYNADKIREMANDWQFSETARLKQAYRMKVLADLEKSYNRTVICDFVCPLSITRDIFNADITIWMNTIVAGRFKDTNKIFEDPVNKTYVVDKFMTHNDVDSFVTMMYKDFPNV